MRINKITTGYVVQTWDTALNKWISQRFVAGDETSYEKADGDAADPIEPGEVWPGWPDTEPYLPFEMKPPEEIQAGASRFYLFEIIDDVEPQLHGPFQSPDQRDERAVELRGQDPRKRNGLYRLDLCATVEPEAGPYSGAELE